MIKKFILLALAISVIAGCSNNEGSADSETKSKELTLYSHRHYDTDKEIIAQFEKDTGIKVNVVKASADELIQKMESEGAQSPADLLISVDAGRLVRAKEKGLLQGIDSEAIKKAVPEHLRDAEGHWFSLTKRARAIAYNKDKVKPEDLSTYSALTDAKWKGKILIRSSDNIYNQSLLAALIAHDGKEKAKEWAAGMAKNFARTPKGNDRDQVKAVLAGEGDLAIINSYYLGKLLNSEDPKEVEAGKAVGLFFPDQDGRGTHVNVSGIGVAKHSPNKANAIKFIEYLVSKEAQEKFAGSNFEYPVNPEASIAELLKSWGEFKEDKLALSKFGELNKEAVVIFDEVQWDKGPSGE